MNGPRDTRVAVIGAGIMGAGIAGLFASSGYPTTLVDVDEEALRRATERAKRHFGSTGDLGVASSLPEAVASASVVVEAVPERIELKHEVFSELARHAPHDALLVTNTSTISISRIAEAADPSRVIGMHFFNPVHRMALVEIVVGDGTSAASRDLAVQLVADLGKKSILVRDSPGFATSRLGIALGNEAMRMLEAGVASAADIDVAMRLGYGHPMGPIELADLVGLDARLNNTRSMFEQTGDAHFAPPAILERLVAAGKLGKKSGAGFYTYPDPDEPRS